MGMYAAPIISGLFTLLAAYLTWRLSKFMNAEKVALKAAEDLRRKIEEKSEEDKRKMVENISEIERSCAEESRDTSKRMHELDKQKVDWQSFQESIKRLHLRLDKIVVAVSWLITKQGGNPSEMELTN